MSIIENIKKSTYEEFANNCQTKTYKLLGITFFKKEKTNSAKKYYLFNLPIYVASKTREKSAKRFCGIQFYKRIVRGDRIKYYIFGVQIRVRKLDKSIMPFSNITTSDFFKFLSISNQHQKVFPQFQNKYVGRDIVILGAGPSLKFYEPIKNAIHIGVNRTFKFDKVDLDYLFLIDYPNVKSYIEEANNYNRGKCVKFYGYFYEQYNAMTIPDLEAVSANAFRYYINEATKSEYFHKDITATPLAAFNSIIFSALHFAIFTNPKTIYLAGCDNNFNGYFDGGKQTGVTEKVFNDVQSLKQMNGWNELKRLRNLYYPQTKVVSINPVGLKGMFDEDIFTNDFLEKGLG